MGDMQQLDFTIRDSKGAVLIEHEVVSTLAQVRNISMQSAYLFLKKLINEV